MIKYSKTSLWYVTANVDGQRKQITNPVHTAKMAYTQAKKLKLEMRKASLFKYRWAKDIRVEKYKKLN